MLCRFAQRVEQEVRGGIPINYRRFCVVVLLQLRFSVKFLAHLFGPFGSHLLASLARQRFGELDSRARARNRRPAIFGKACAFLIFASEIADRVAASLSRHQPKLVGRIFSSCVLIPDFVFAGGRGNWAKNGSARRGVPRFEYSDGLIKLHCGRIIDVGDWDERADAPAQSKQRRHCDRRSNNHVSPKPIIAQPKRAQGRTQILLRCIQRGD